MSFGRDELVSVMVAIARSGCELGLRRRLPSLPASGRNFGHGFMSVSTLPMLCRDS